VKSFDINDKKIQKLIGNITHPILSRVFYLFRLPSLFFWGVRVREVNDSFSAVTIPFSWRTQNPFKSTYFAALTGAAELSTGILALMACRYYGNVSMLVVNSQGSFSKKVNKRVTFKCEDAKAIIEAVHSACENGEPTTITAKSIGSIEGVGAVAEFEITWSFKRRAA